MKRFLLLLVIGVVAGLFIGGCGMVDTYPERERRYSNITGYHARMFIDDLDLALLADRPTYMSYWHLRDAD